MKRLNLIAILFLLISSNVKVQGQTTYIVGGQSTPQGQLPWMAQLRTNGSHSCGGTLIAPQWVLTAAHCITGNPITVRLNSVNSNDPQVHPAGAELGVQQIFKHPQSTSIDYDVALLKLDTAVANISTIDLIDAADSTWVYNTGTSVELAGWGLDQTQQLPGFLKNVTSQVYDFMQCLGSTNPQVGNRIFCIGYQSGQTPSGTGSGDSGGPAWLLKNGVKKQIGIVNGGPASGITEADDPSIFAKVSFYRSWIDSVVQANTTFSVNTDDFKLDSDAIEYKVQQQNLSINIGNIKSREVNIKLIDINGAVVSVRDLFNPAFQTANIDLSNFSKGMYIVYIQDEKGFYQSKKIFTF